MVELTKLWRSTPLFISMALALSGALSGCLPSATVSSTCPSGKSFDSGTRSCVAQELQVTNANNQPVPGSSLSYTIAEGALAVLNFTLPPATDDDGETLSYVMGTPPAYGAITGCMNMSGSTGLDDRSCLYTYDPEFAGTATLKYRVHDGTDYSTALGLVTFVVSPVNDNPSFVATPLATATAFYEDTPASLEFTFDEGLQGTDENDQSVNVSVTNLGNTLIVPDSSIGIYYAGTPVGTASSTSYVTLCGTADCAANKLKLVLNPAANTNTTSGTWSTNPVNLQITLTDSLGGTTTLSNVGLTFNAVNDAPTFPTPTPLATATAREDYGVSVNMRVEEGGGSDEDAQSMTVSVVATAVAGSPIPVSQVYFYYNSVLLGNGDAARSLGDGALDVSLSDLTIKVTPIPNYDGTTNFRLTFTDSLAATAVANFGVVINAFDDAPSFPIAPPRYTMLAATEDTPVSFSFSADEGGGVPEDIQNLSFKAEVVGTCGAFANSDMTFSVDSVASTTFTAGSWNAIESDSTTDYSTKVLSLTIVPTANANGTCGVRLALDDDAAAGATPTAEAVASFAVNFAAVNDDPVIAEATAAVSTNEGTEVTGITMSVDEGGLSGGSSPKDEDAQGLQVKVSTSNATLLPLSRITMTKFDNSTFHPSSTSYTSLKDNLHDHLTTLLEMAVSPVHGYNGTATLTITLSDGYTTATQIVSVVVSDNTFTWNGWTSVKAYGETSDARGNSVSTPGPYAYLAWATPEPIGTNAAISGYNVYRYEGETVAIENFDLTSPLNTTPITTDYFEDGATYSLSDATAYWYLVLPINSVNNQVMMNYGDDRMIRVVVPDDNRALVHRWMVNKEVCENQGLTPDRTNNYRCDYNAPGAVWTPSVTGSYFDLSTDLVVDRWEAGCNYSRTTCNSGNPCINNGNPNTLGYTGEEGNLYYDRGTGMCWINTNGADQWMTNYCPYSLKSCWDSTDYFNPGPVGAPNPGGPTDTANCIGVLPPSTSEILVTGYDPDDGSTPNNLTGYYLDSSARICYQTSDSGQTWTAVSDIDMTLEYSSSGATQLNVPKNPPLVFYGAQMADNSCSEHSAVILNMSPRAHAMRLPSRMDQIAFNRWDSSVSIATMESGGSLNTQSVCNTTVANGLTYTSADVPSTPYWDTLPASAVATATINSTPVALRTVITASNATLGCTSAYGIQDGIGNVREWADEKLTASSCASGLNCEQFAFKTSYSNTLSTTRPDFNDTNNDDVGDTSYNFNSVEGPDLISDNGGDTFRTWNMLTGPSVPGYSNFYLAFGLPALDTPTGDSLALSSTTLTSLISGDMFRMENEFIGNVAKFGDLQDVTGGIAGGGSFNPESGNGDEAGRFILEIIRSHYQGADTGFRCVAPIGYSE